MASNVPDATPYEAAIPEKSQDSKRSLGDLVVKWSRSQRIAEHPFKEKIDATERQIVGNKATTGITDTIVTMGSTDGKDITKTRVAEDDVVTMHSMDGKDTTDTISTSDDMAIQSAVDSIHDASPAMDSSNVKLDDDRNIAMISTTTTTTTTTTATSTTTIMVTTTTTTTTTTTATSTTFYATATYVSTTSGTTTTIASFYATATDVATT